MDRSKKNAKELHYEHLKWLAELEEMKVEVVTLAKNNKNDFTKEIGSTLKKVIGLKKIIIKHEQKIALAFKACGIQDYDEIFSDHQNIRHEMSALRSNLDNLNILIAKYRNPQAAS